MRFPGWKLGRVGGLGFRSCVGWLWGVSFAVYVEVHVIVGLVFDEAFGLFAAGDVGNLVGLGLVGLGSVVRVEAGGDEVQHWWLLGVGDPTPYRTTSKACC